MAGEAAASEISAPLFGRRRGCAGRGQVVQVRRSPLFPLAPRFARALPIDWSASAVGA